MALENYRDISRTGSDTDAGFQFEFQCDQCGRGWKSPFKPYRKGQLAGLLQTFSFFFNDRGGIARGGSGLASAGEKSARNEALQEAQVLAAQRYTACPRCEQRVCSNCFVQAEDQCQNCSLDAAKVAQVKAPSAGAAASSCPNCGTAANGRFCAECGFDMASTHKSCPGCGVMCLRQARFCTDCGHGF